MLIHNGEEVSSASIGGWRDWPHDVGMDDLEWVSGGIKVTFEWNSSYLSFHAAVTAGVVVESYAWENRADASNTSMAKAVVPHDEWRGLS